MSKAKTNKDLATELCEKFPKATSKQLGRMLFSEHRERFKDERAAYDVIRQARGAIGKSSRKGATVEYEHKKAGWSPECPPSLAEEWRPFEVPGPCRVLSISDIHIPYHDKAALEAAVVYGKKLKPDVLLILGDYADFYGCSRYDKDPKKRNLKQEIELGREGLSWLAGQFPQARRIYKMGNHDERWNKYLWNKAPELVGLSNVEIHEVLKFAEFGFERVGDEPVMLGHLPALHGHEIGKGIFSPVNPARGAFLRTNHTVLIGHLHRTSSHADSNMWHEEVMAYSQGCLCDMRPEYARFNKWNLGFAHIDVAADGQFDMHNYRLSEDYTVRAA